MDRATFFKHFDLLADQPDAVAKMREWVLQLAVRGQLVDQIAADQKDAEEPFAPHLRQRIVRRGAEQFRQHVAPRDVVKLALESVEHPAE